MAGWWWVVFTVLAAGSQTFRNAMQRTLTTTIGTIGATQVRFLFGLPFSALFVLALSLRPGFEWPAIPPMFWAWVTAGAVSQIAATALMLLAMGQRSFVVATAYIKTDPVLVTLFGLVFLGDHLGLLGTVAMLMATVGVMTMSWPKAGATAPVPGKSALATILEPACWGIGAGAGFALASVAFRGAILSLGDGPFFDRASITLLFSLLIQSGLLAIYLIGWARPVFAAILGVWRTSLVAGFLGAFASQMWFLAFAVETAARVRTLALIEILFAQAVSRRLFAQGTSGREKAGIVLVVVGVVVLLMT